jgi:hypothetical protein
MEVLVTILKVFLRALGLPGSDLGTMILLVSEFVAY